MLLRVCITSLVSALLIAPPASAQSAPDDDSIVIEKTLNSQRQIGTFVKELTPARIGTQLGRFLEPICPKVAGLPKGQNELVEARMRKVAAAIGAPVAPEKCVVDLFVLVGPDKREVIQNIRKDYPALVAGVPDSVLKRLESAEGPVAAWQIVGRVGTDGMPLTSMRTSAGGEPVLIANTVGWASRIVNVTRPQFLGSILVVEAKALNGVDTRQLADYAVMRTLAPTDTTRQAALPAGSIIQLFDPGISPDTAPASVTWWDFAFLKALYSSSNSLAASQQRGEMSRKMAKELAKVPPEKN